MTIALRPFPFAIKKSRPVSSAALTVLSFKVGRHYQLRSGAVVKLTEIGSDPRYRFLTGTLLLAAHNTDLPHVCTLTWGPDGKRAAGCFEDGTEPDSPTDIVREVTATMMRRMTRKEQPQ